MKLPHSLPLFLAASPQILDPRFQYSVLLLVEHDEHGALGFVINNKSHMKLKDVVAFHHERIPQDIPVWNAGPVDSSAGFVLHNQQIDFYERKIAEGVSLSSSQDSLLKLIEHATGASSESPKELYPYRLLVGYAGWGPRQLDDELLAGFWIPAPLSRDILFNVNFEFIWSRTLQSVGHNLSCQSQFSSFGQWVH